MNGTLRLAVNGGFGGWSLTLAPEADTGALRGEVSYWSDDLNRKRVPTPAAAVAFPCTVLQAGRTRAPDAAVAVRASAMAERLIEAASVP